MAVTPPRLEAPWFGEGRPAAQFPTLARVLAYTARQHCPGWDVHVYHVPDHSLRSPLGSQSHADNTHKMEVWAATVAAAAEGDRLLLIDADTFITNPLDELWEQEFDFAYTTKDSRFPFNSGVVAWRVNGRSRAFAEAWRTENVRLLRNPTAHQVWRKRYGGINQAALGSMLEQQVPQRLGLRVLELPCPMWNCEDSSWPLFDAASTRIVHVKSALRMAVFHLAGCAPRLRPLVARWNEAERASRVPAT